MHRRTFLRTAGLAATAAVAGCLASAGSQSTASASPSGEWRQATGGSGNTSRAPSVHASKVAWAVGLPERYATPPIVADGTIVVGTASGSVLAFDLATGEQRWQQGTAGAQGTPAVVDTWVVVPADDGRLHRFALADGSTRASNPLGSSLLSAVTAHQNRAYVIARPATLVAIDVPNWRVDWTVDLEIRGVGKPAVDDEYVFVSGTRPDGSGDILALDSATGRESWRIRGTKGFHQTPVRTDSGLIVSGEHGNRLERWSAADDWKPSGTFWFDAGGELRRAESIPGPIWNHCDVRFLTARSDRTTISGCNALLQYRPDTYPWSKTIPQGVTTRPLATPNGLLVGDAHGQFWLVDDTSKTEMFEVGGIHSTPAVLDQGVIVAADGRLIARV